MSYDGEALTSCQAQKLDLSKIEVVAVSGDGPNPCGHLLLHVPQDGGWYFHVAALRGQPKAMRETGYRRYLQAAGKRELRRRALKLPNPDAAYLYLEGLLAEKWTWAVLPNNCVAFVEEVIAAGGGDWGSYSNCPAVATADSVQERLNRFYRWMESSVFAVYGLSR